MRMRVLTAVILLTCGALRAGGEARSAEPGSGGGRMEDRIRKLEQELGDLKRQVQGASAAQPEPKPQGQADEDLGALRRAAQKEAGTREAGPETDPGDTVFKSGGLSLQALNPEISVTGDMLSYYRDQEDVRERWDADFRTLGIHVEGYLDPYTHFKAAVPVNDNGAELGEAYVTRFGVIEGLNVTAGKFRQQFGVVNRWHKHGLDQIDFPVPLRAIFGDGGLNQTGFSFDWAMPPLFGASEALTVQVTNPDNGRLFGDDLFGTPTVLGRYRLYRDLTKDLYVELGVTGLVGWNDEWEVDPGTGPETVHDTHPTAVLGADLALLWEPTGRMRYRNIEWRSELYVLNRRLEATDNSGEDTVEAWGFFTYLQAKITRTLDVGVRYDYYRPDHKDYAAVPGLELTPHALVADDEYQWQLSPYVTWHQSPFVKVRLQWDHNEGFMDEQPENQIWLQIIFAIGPHKHERY